MNTATSEHVAAGVWGLDPIHSTLEFRVRHLGLTWLRGSFKDFEASLTSTADGQLRLEGATPVTAIAFSDEQLSGHLQSPDFFNTQLHPQLSYHSTTIDLQEDGTAVIAGELTMKGIAQPVEMRGTWVRAIEDPFGGQRLGLEISGEIDRHAWGINWNAPLPGGGTILGPRVRIAAALELVQQ